MALAGGGILPHPQVPALRGRPFGGFGLGSQPSGWLPASRAAAAPNRCGCAKGTAASGRERSGPEGRIQNPLHLSAWLFSLTLELGKPAAR
ncbi:hypothetical protein METH_06175 [Leisingera methylohalidivorans DSM 14336]|uniref:Uncharacterized protein n=1 Tax=Leisingera methylohalidivorans DSM 14336 TaxID=999552 RepID=V9W175_9RHOB|nr:hypothetical protein METH_06175 [Leisingera methylohalidivorans DSM 14336]